MRRTPLNFAQVAFEEVVADPQGSLRRLSRRLGLAEDGGTGVEAHLAAVEGFLPEGASLSPADERRLLDLWAPEIALYGRA